MLPDIFDVASDTSTVGQVWINIAAALASCTGPLIIGALTRADPVNGWRKFWVWS